MSLQDDLKKVQTELAFFREEDLRIRNEIAGNAKFKINQTVRAYRGGYKNTVFYVKSIRVNKQGQRVYRCLDVDNKNNRPWYPSLNESVLENA
jgi:hypothetical protein